jgi:hypothetical protein
MLTGCCARLFSYRNFDGNANISGILDLTRLQEFLEGNNSANHTIKVSATKGSTIDIATFPVISLRNTQISGITPPLDALEKDIETFLRNFHTLTMSTSASFNNLGGIL